MHIVYLFCYIQCMDVFILLWLLPYPYNFFFFIFFFFNDTATTEIYTYRHPLSLHAALPIYEGFACYAGWLWGEVADGIPADRSAREHWSRLAELPQDIVIGDPGPDLMFDDRLYKRGALTLHALRNEVGDASRSEEHTSELQSLMRTSYAVFCLKKKKK